MTVFCLYTPALQHTVVAAQRRLVGKHVHVAQSYKFFLPPQHDCSSQQSKGHLASSGGGYKVPQHVNISQTTSAKLLINPASCVHPYSIGGELRRAHCPWHT
jgi:hypothetical protein